MPTIVDFYQLSGSPLERVLPRICERLLESGERLLIITETEQVDRLDTLLWTYRADAFLPHGLLGGEGACDQPILIGSEIEPANGAHHLAIADGRWREEALKFTRTFYFFDQDHLDDARRAWRGLNSDEVERRYWKQVNGKWVQGP